MEVRAERVQNLHVPAREWGSTVNLSWTPTCPQPSPPCQHRPLCATPCSDQTAHMPPPTCCHCSLCPPNRTLALTPTHPWRCPLCVQRPAIGGRHVRPRPPAGIAPNCLFPHPHPSSTPPPPGTPPLDAAPCSWKTAHTPPPTCWQTAAWSGRDASRAVQSRCRRWQYRACLSPAASHTLPQWWWLGTSCCLAR